MPRLHDNSLKVYKGVAIYDDQEVDVRDYSSLAMALLAAEGTGKALLVSEPVDVLIPTTIAVPVKVVPGGTFVKIGTGTLSFTKSFEAFFNRIFYGFAAGEVTFSAGTLSEVRPEWWGGGGNGITVSTGAIQSAINSLPATGGSIHFTSGLWLLDRVDILGQYVHLFGNGNSSILQRNADLSTDLLFVAGAGFALSNIKVQEAASDWTNTGSLVKLQNISDASITGSWFFYGYDQVSVDVADNLLFQGNIAEGSRRSAIRGNQLTLSKIIGNSFFAGTLNPIITAESASIYLQRDAGYTFNAQNVNIVGNYFYYSRYGHFVSLKKVTGVQIDGNFFGVAGMFNPNSVDDIYVDESTQINIVGNSYNAVNNNYTPGNRGTRYCINVTATSSQVTVVGNSFTAGISGTVNDASGIVYRVGNTYSDSTSEDMHSSSSSGSLLLGGGAATGASAHGAYIDLRGILNDAGNLRLVAGDGGANHGSIIFGLDGGIQKRKFTPNGSGAYPSDAVSLDGVTYIVTVYGTAAPVAGTWTVGSRIINSVPSVGQPKSWVCTVAGAPGTWVSEGNL